MSKFVHRLIERQAVSSQVVTPRLRSKFEPEAIPSQSWAMESVVKAGGEPDASPRGLKENALSLPAATGTSPGDHTKEEPGRTKRMEERPVETSDRLAEPPEKPLGNKEPGRRDQQEEKKPATSLQQAAKRETEVTKPSPKAALEETAGQQDIRHEKREPFGTTPEQRSVAEEEGIPHQKIMVYDTQPETPVKKETRPREEGLQERGLFGEAAAGGRKSADPSVGRMTPEPAPVIRVNIGRIEVHAIHPQPVQPVRTPAAAKPQLSLDDFLKKRNEL